MISPAKQQVPSIFDFLLFTMAVVMKGLLRTPLYHTLWINQMGYMKVKAQLPGIVNPRQLGFNYYLYAIAMLLPLVNLAP